jgi:hypothetical protein
MSDATRANEARGRGPASPDLASAQQPTSGKKRWAHRMWDVGRVLATIATVLLLYSFWVPWVVILGATYSHVGDNFYENAYTLTIGPGDLDSLYGPAYWSAISGFGLLICLLLWQRAWPALAWTGVLVYGSWLGFLPIVMPDFPAKDRIAFLLDPTPTGEPLIVDIVRWLPGHTLFSLSVVAAWVALILLGVSRLMLREEFHAAVWMHPT